MHNNSSLSNWNKVVTFAVCFEVHFKEKVKPSILPVTLAEFSKML